ncbi:hypothetical protein HPB51_017719 [Rhipicephalus microplus]|uniref:Soluble epoxide hydrolase n=1 Tax=Rhipicephalus microplus TaxID=6941 RepID=A0A9J6E369_RHIMP|nr:hypothetical protein HPB51_017719 [Rhipicephalus microplus]
MRPPHCSFMPTNDPPRTVIIQESAQAPNGRSGRVTPSKKIDEKLSFILLPSSLPRILLSGALTGVLNYYRAFNFDSDQFTKLNYRKIRVPTLILWSEKDRFLTTPIAEFNREHLKRSFVVYYPEGGHWLMRQCADSVNNHIIEFASTGRIIYNESMAQSQIRLAEFSCAESPKLSKKS